MDHPLLAIAQPVTHVTGDGIIALFGTPIAHEDHAIRTCYAALAMQDAIRRYSEGDRLIHSCCARPGSYSHSRCSGVTLYICSARRIMRWVAEHDCQGRS